MNVERDAGFCSGSSENGDEFQRDDPRSPTDASDDSMDVKLMPISIPKNKRKSLEPSRVVAETDYPLKKRIRFDEKFQTPDTSVAVKSEPGCDQTNPFRPWASVTEAADGTKSMLNPAAEYVRHPGVTTLHRIPNVTICPPPTTTPKPTQSATATIDDAIQEQPLALLKKRYPSEASSSFRPDDPVAEYGQPSPSSSTSSSNYHHHHPPPPPPSQHHQQQYETISNSEASNNDDATTSAAATEAFISMMAAASSGGGGGGGIENHLLHHNSNSSDSFGSQQKHSSSMHHRNYKNMTRERRIEANARERTRVHTISAAYDTLRKAIPSYSQSQKLSKLSVLRVACSYILTLSRIAGDDYSHDQSAPSVNECTDEVSRTIQTEGKIRKKKDEQ